ncbi:MAG TPA: hypothetical protein VHB45_13015 [Alloacidobacterium sp.]|nr:hypothetical protein [Alloacidobacterium sp.]
MDLARARAVCEVSQTIINSAKVEIEMLQAVDSVEVSEFFGGAAVIEGRREKRGAACLGTRFALRKVR